MGDVKEDEEEDRISQLSDDLLCQILSDLDSRVAVQTSVLSKRWVHLWTTLPCINFEPNPYAHTHHSDYIFKFVTNFLNYRNQESVISTIKVDGISHIDNKICLDKKICQIDDWVLPSLTSLYLRNVFFGDHISGFQNLKELTLTGRIYQILWDIKKVITINCPNLQRLALGSYFSHCSLVVSAPKLCYFGFRTGYVPFFSAGDGFPCIKEVDFDFEFKDDNGDLRVGDKMFNILGLAMQSLDFIAMLNAVRETPLLKLSRETIKFLRRVLGFSQYQPCPLCNLKFLYLQGLNEMPTRSTDHVISYLLSNSPHAEILKGQLGGIRDL